MFAPFVRAESAARPRSTRLAVAKKRAYERRSSDFARHVALGESSLHATLT
jgi:hypothetical protein